MREEENKRSSQGSSVKRFFKKRWVFPAIYIASAAILLSGVLWYQTSTTQDTDKYDYKSSDIAGKKFDQPSIEVSKSLENVKMPVDKSVDAVVKMKFYDFSAKAEDQEAALVFYNNTFVPNTGIDITSKDGESFDVVASLSGTVTRVDEDPVLGNVIEVEHAKGVVTQYQSVKDIDVSVGDQVKQGQVLAKAGQSLFNEKAGIHVHFEIRKDGVAVNPSDYFNKSVSVLQDAVMDDKAGDSSETSKMKTKQRLDADPSSDQGSDKGSDQEPGTDGESTDSLDTTNS